MQRSTSPEKRLLTPRQLEVLELMAKGLTNKEIAGVLGISAGTAKNHVAAIIDALGVGNRTEAAVALRALAGEAGEGESDEDASAARSAFTVPGFGARPAIAVLPFESFGSEPEQEHFADGLVEDLITRLAAWRWFPVIARNSSFVYKGRAVDVAEASRELGARYVLEGSCRKAGDRVRVNAQLIRGATSEHVWAKQYDRAVADVFALQDEIVDAIVGALQPALLSLEGLRAARREPASLDAWECAHRGVHHGYRRTPDELAEARRWFERSAASDPHFAPAFWGLAATLLGQFAYAGVEAAKTLPPALQHARRAVELDAADPMSHLILAGALWLTGQAGPSLSALERAVELNPSSAYAHWGLGMSLRTPERADEAVAGFEKAIRLSPQDPMRGEFLAFLASTHLLRGRDEDALEAARKAVACRPDLTLGHGVIAAAHALLGHRAEAEAAVAEVLRREPDPAQSLRLIRAFHPPALVERYVDGLRKAGWPG